MEKFTTLTSQAVPFPQVNVDTDIIIPADNLKTIGRTGLGAKAFTAIRFDEAGNKIADNIFDDPRYGDAQILIAGDNFGCGSSREHAPWAIADMGFRALVAPSFADIFASNCVKNGLLTITLDVEIVNTLVEDAKDLKAFTVDLNAQTLTRENGQSYSFPYNAVHKEMLLNGLDEIGQTLKSEAAIAAFEEKQRMQTPWLYRGK